MLEHPTKQGSIAVLRVSAPGAGLRMADKDSPFRIPPTQPHIISISGGRSSGFMLYKILEAHEGVLPENVKVIFCNTGKELEATLDFVDCMQREWRVPVTWLEYRYYRNNKGTANDPRHCFEVVNHDSASRQGQPFEMLIESRRRLPNIMSRICTMELKVRTIERYLRRKHGLKSATYASPADYVKALGIRQDEPRRWKRIAARDCNVSMPLVFANVQKRDVERFWERQSFDLAIPSQRGNCDLCFLKGKKELMDTLEERPDLADWWVKQESSVGGTFNSVFSYHDLLSQVQMGNRAGEAEGPVEDCYCGD